MARNRSRRRRQPKPDRETGRAGQGAPRRIVGWRLWALRLAAVVLAPLGFLGCLELGLRAGGYGYPTSFFLASGSEAVYVTNGRFGWRFFPRDLARAPHPAWFPAEKREGTYRIFVLGGSAAQGVPDPAYGFSRILEVMLQERYPGARFEVVNAAMTAINSHVVLPIARECADHDADLLVVYMGNNEVVGPYGAGTVFGPVTPGLGAIRAGVRVKATRVGQLAGDVVRAFADEPEVSGRWKGMEMFLANQVAADDPRLARVYDHFQANLSDICIAAADAGAATILCTVVTKLRDCPPFASLHRADLAEADLKRWQQAYDAAVALEARGKHGEAAEAFGRAADIDDRYAELHYRLGRCLEALERFDQAREHLVLARDLDALRFRADTRINAIIREVASARQAEGVHLADAAEVFTRHADTPHGLPGSEWLHEHVHLTFRGNWLLARTVVERVAALVPASIRARASAEEPVPDAERCAQRLALTGWDRHRMASSIVRVMGRPPFTNQIDHEAALAARQGDVDALARYTTPEALREAADVYRAALERRPEDDLLRRNFATLQSRRGDQAGAIEQLQIVLRRFPDNASARELLGVAFALQGRLPDAIREYREALRLNPSNAAMYKNWGDALVLLKRPDEAADTYREALRLNPEYFEVLKNLSGLYLLEDKRNAALPYLTAAVRLQPWAAGHFQLATLLAERGQRREAIDHLHKALALEPDDPKLLEDIRKTLRALGGPP